ncbi:family 20 glycosylhydrolase [Rheinheimera sp. NSM]|uniref:family 20 glycosylhydrolase n=1 Tax=Rheinheimera sp. NSM TaxID=3457884 RepID=UPI0040359C16
MPLLRVLFCLLLTCCCQPALAAASFTQQQLADFANDSSLVFSVLSNNLAEPSRFSAAITLHNGSGQTLPGGKSDWQIYFHSIRRIDTIQQQGLILQHVQGDLHRLSPDSSFAGLAPGKQLRISYTSAPWVVSYSDFMPRAFITATGLTPAVFANTDTEQLSQFVTPITTPQQQLRNSGTADLVPVVTAATRFAHNAKLNVHGSAADIAQRIIPTPLQAKFSKHRLTLNTDWHISYSGRLTGTATYLQQQLQQLGLSLQSSTDSSVQHTRQIRLSVDSSLPLAAEGYQLEIKDKHISLIGKDNAGAFYAVQSLLALAQQTDNRIQLPLGKVADQPRAPWRGMHYDMARNFHGKDVTLRLIDNMARYKLNKLHLHLTEDEGWRLEIPGLPELTDIGGQRCFDLTEQQCLLTQLGTGPHKTGSGNGYYSTADFIEILQYAAVRQIEVIPEIDLPGHARAAIVAMKARYNRLQALGQPEAAAQYLLSDPDDSSRYLSVQNYTDSSANVCLASTYAFVEKVVYELQQMYRSAGVKLNTFHMGGDEVAAGSWLGSPACQQLFATADNGIAGVADLKPWFVSRVAEITHRRGLNLAGWEDGLMYDQQNTFNRNQFANDKVIANAWDNIWEWGVADRAYRLANNGYQVVLSPGTHLYFDHPHEAHPLERGYYWATRFSSIDKVFGFMPDNLYANADTTRDGAPIADLEALVGREMPALQQAQNILGIQGQLWSETVRTAEQLEQMIYPRMLALAERAWHKAAWEQSNNLQQAQQQRQRDWHSFAARLGQIELARLANNGSSFYLPPPGAITTAAGIKVNNALPGLYTEFSTDQGASWQPYQAPLAIATKPLWLRSRHQAVHSRTVEVTNGG